MSEVEKVDAMQRFRFEYDIYVKLAKIISSYSCLPTYIRHK